MATESGVVGPRPSDMFSLTRMIYVLCTVIILYELFGLGIWLLVTRVQQSPLGFTRFDLLFHGANLAFVLTMLGGTLPYRPKLHLLNWRITDERLPSRLIDGVVWGVAGGLAATALASPFFWLGDGKLESIRTLMARALSPAGVLILVLFVVALAISSETLYRGVVFRTLEQYATKPAAALASCLLFAVVCPVFSYPAAIILGMVAAILFYRTRTLLAPIVANVLFTLGGGAITLYRGLMRS